LASVNSIPVESIISRIHAVLPSVPNNYIMMLINDALVELGMYKTKFLNVKLDITADKMWYDIGDTGLSSFSETEATQRYLKLNKLSRVDIMDSEGDYIRIPRLLDKNILLSDVDSDEDAIEFP